MSKGRAVQLREIRAREVSPGDAEMLRSTVEIGVSRSEAVVLKIDLDRIQPDFDQPRRIMPSDLHERLRNGQISPREAMEQLLLRRDSDELVRMILEGDREASGLLGLAESIGEVGLRQPINVYEIADASHPTGVGYRIGEGERRYWAHWILVLDGREEFKSIRCVVERGVPGDLQVRVRQLAENAVRQDLPAMARARLMLGLKTCLARGAGIGVSPAAGLQDLGHAITQARYRGLGTRMTEGVEIEKEGEGGLATRVAKLSVPDSNELDDMVGQTLRRYTGKAVSGQMVRNYLALLRLPQAVQELADAASLAEFRLRAVVGLDDADQQLRIVERIVQEDLSGRQVDALAKEAESRVDGWIDTFARVRTKSLTPRALKRRVRSMVTYFEEQMAEMGGVCNFSGELHGVEDYREAVDEMASLRDLLNSILEQVWVEDQTPGARVPARRPANE